MEVWRLWPSGIKKKKKNPTTSGGRLREGSSSVAYHYLSPYHNAPHASLGDRLG